VSVIPAIAPTGATASPSQICLGDSSTLSAGASGYPNSFSGVEDFNSASLDNSGGWRATENGGPHNIEASADNQLNTPGISQIQKRLMGFCMTVEIQNLPSLPEQTTPRWRLLFSAQSECLRQPEFLASI
jgi:hypothetical protein